MESLIETFHIDWKLLTAQIVNFAIAFAVLYFFALKPLAKVMKERSDKISKGIEDSKEIEKKLSQTQEDYKAEIVKAKKEAADILAKAGELAEEQKKQSLSKAKEEIAAVINQEKAKIAAEKLQTVKEIKEEIADLVGAAVEKVLEERVEK